MGYYAYDSITTCGLCDVFKYTKTQCCIDCPITKYCQGVVFCRDNKPYLDYQEAMDQESEQKAAAEEVKFLKYLQSIYNFVDGLKVCELESFISLSKK